METMYIDTLTHPYACYAAGRCAHMSTIQAAASHLIAAQDKASYILQGERRWEYHECHDIASAGIRAFSMRRRTDE